jgi:hypothetical protein
MFPRGSVQSLYSGDDGMEVAQVFRPHHRSVDAALRLGRVDVDEAAQLCDSKARTYSSCPPLPFREMLRSRLTRRSA